MGCRETGSGEGAEGSGGERGDGDRRLILLFLVFFLPIHTSTPVFPSAFVALVGVRSDWTGLGFGCGFCMYGFFTCATTVVLKRSGLYLLRSEGGGGGGVGKKNNVVFPPDTYLEVKNTYFDRFDTRLPGKLSFFAPTPLTIQYLHYLHTNRKSRISKRYTSASIMVDR